MNEISRRDFLKITACGVGGALFSKPCRKDSFFQKEGDATPRTIYRDQLDVWPPGTVRWASYERNTDGTIYLRTHDESYPIPQEALPESGRYRDSHHYIETIQYLHPLESLRYQPYKKKQSDSYPEMTYCNIWAWDVTRCMKVEIPRWMNGVKTDAESIIPLLSGSVGTFLGWKESFFLDAQNQANSGIPTVLVDPGHISVVMPGPDAHDPLLANVGRIVAFGIPASEIWTNKKRFSSLRCFFNDSKGYQFVPESSPLG